MGNMGIHSADRQRIERRTRSVNEAARLLGVAPNSLRAAIKRGEIHGIRIGKRLVIPLSTLQAILGESVEGKGAA